jgi:hypothetical protein
LFLHPFSYNDNFPRRSCNYTSITVLSRLEFSKKLGNYIIGVILKQRSDFFGNFFPLNYQPSSLLASPLSNFPFFYNFEL